MELTADFHTHTRYSDGSCTVDELVARAKELNLRAIGLTDHGFSHFFGLRRQKREAYLREIQSAERKYGLKVYAGIEANLVGEGLCDLKESDYADFELFLCGAHLFSRRESLGGFCKAWRGALARSLSRTPSASLVKEQTNAYIRAVERHPIDVLTHVNFRCFSDAVEVAKCCRDFGTYLELNGKKSHFSDEELGKVACTGVRFLLNSDAHSPDRLGDVEIALQQVKRVGIDRTLIDNIDGRMPHFRFAEYKKRYL